MKNASIHAKKPIALYDWILMRYMPNGGKILDTHVGSASSLIACERAGVQYVGFEKNQTVFELANTRLTEHRAQITLMEVMK